MYASREGPEYMRLNSCRWDGGGCWVLVWWWCIDGAGRSKSISIYSRRDAVTALLASPDQRVTLGPSSLVGFTRSDISIC